jgi:hypothetical protein
VSGWQPRAIMNRHQKHPHLIVRNPAYRQAFERLDEALEKNTQPENSEKIQLLGRLMFGDLWHEHKQTRTGILPK